MNQPTAGKPVSLDRYRVRHLLDRLSLVELLLLEDGIEELQDLLRCRVAEDMSAQRAIATGLITEGELYTAFGLTPAGDATWHACPTAAGPGLGCEAAFVCPDSCVG